MAEATSDPQATLNIVAPPEEKIDTLLTTDQLENFGLKSRKAGASITFSIRMSFYMSRVV